MDDVLMHPLTDIVVLVHNGLDITKGFLKKFFANTENYHLIFVNNGSTDGTSEFLKQGAEEGKWSLVDLVKNAGIILGRNIAASYLVNSPAGYFLNIDNDQYPEKGWLESLHSLMEQGYDIVGSEAWKLQPPGKGGAAVIDGNVKDLSYFPVKQCKRKSEAFTYIGCGGMLIKKSVYNQIGLFDEQFSPAYYEDPDFCFRAIQAGFKLGWQPACKITHLAHQKISRQNLFTKNDQFNQSWQRFKKKWNGFYPQPIRMPNA